MLKQHFARLDVERLEEVVVPNMIFGPMPLSSPLEIPAWEGPSLERPQSSS
jgi:hypothetical protein